MRTSILTLILSLFLLSSCQDEALDEELYHTWGQPVMISVESVAYPKEVDGSILLTFKRDGSYILKLEVNNCSGSFEHEIKDSIRLSTPGCTEMCCDSQFGQKVASMLAKVRSHKIENHTLQLQVPQWGFIEMKLVE